MDRGGNIHCKVVFRNKRVDTISPTSKLHESSTRYHCCLPNDVALARNNYRTALWKIRLHDECAYFCTSLVFSTLRLQT